MNAQDNSGSGIVKYSIGYSKCFVTRCENRQVYKGKSASQGHGVDGSLAEKTITCTKVPEYFGISKLTLH